MELPDIVGGKANDTAVLSTDAVLAGELQDHGLANWQHRTCQIAGHHNVNPRCVSAERHQATLAGSAVMDFASRFCKLAMNGLR